MKVSIGEKSKLRKDLKDSLSEISSEQRNREETAVTEKILAIDQWQRADLVLGYLAFGNEFSVDCLLEKALSLGKKVAVPVIEGDRISFYLIRSLSPSQFVLNRGIREPIEKKNSGSPELFRSPLVLVPGLGFTVEGRRLGRGGGFYDRFLEAYPSGKTRLFTLGVCYSNQIMEILPVEKHDRKVDMVVYSSGLG